MVVWKFHDPKQIEQMDLRGKFESYRVSLENQVLADLSIFSFLKIIAKLSKLEHILRYNDN